MGDGESSIGSRRPRSEHHAALYGDMVVELEPQSEG